LVQAVCARAGLSPEQLEPRLVERMALLAERTPIFEDNARAMELAEQVFEYCAYNGEAFTETEKTTVRVGSLLSDIGKTGPRDATADQQRLIASIFTVDRVGDEKMPVEQFFRDYFAQDAAERIARFMALGLDPKMTLRQFWNMHSGWTLELLQHSAVPPEAVAAAAAHHLLEHVNPRSIVADDGRFTLPFGSNSSFDRTEKLVILLDKYDAVRRRGHRDHAAAIDWLRALVSKHSRFGKDQEFHTLIDVLDEVFAQGAADSYK
jgi:hypothetical protein